MSGSLGQHIGVTGNRAKNQRWKGNRINFVRAYRVVHRALLIDNDQNSKDRNLLVSLHVQRL